MTDAGAGEARAPRRVAVALAWGPALVAAVSVLALSVLTLAPNRLAAPQPLGGPGAIGPAAYAVAALALLAALMLSGDASGRRRLLALAAALLALALLAGAAGEAARTLLAGRPPAARVSLGAGFWLAAAGTLAVALEAARRLAWPGAGGLVVAGLCAAGLAAAWSGAFDALSLAVEYRARADLLQAALARHLLLAAGSLGLALLAAIPFGLMRFRGGRAGAGADALLNGIQVVPALALFGALVAMLSALLRALPALRDLGLAAIGPTPALVGTAAYLVLPLARSIAAGLASPEDAVIDSAVALGMTPTRVTTRVRLPLGMPILLGGLRVAVVQSIGFSTLGGLVGAGGLGAIVLEGMSQFASDLILLGAIPVIALSLLADGLLRLAAMGLGGEPGDRR